MAFLNPAKVVEKIDVRPGMKVADFGCGGGYFTLEAARRAGPSGVVYAFDARREPLEAVKSGARTKNLSNIEIARADLETKDGSGLADSILDLVFVFNILFQAEDKEAVVREAFRVLKPAGRAATVEQESRVAKQAAEEIFSKAGFTKSREFDAGESHYGLIYIKP